MIRRTKPERATASRTAVLSVFAVSGATALIYQVIWSRWLGLVFGCTAMSVSIVLGSFMLGLALGSFAAGRLLQRPISPLRTYGLLELGIGLFATFVQVFTHVLVKPGWNRIGLHVLGSDRPFTQSP